MRFLFASWYPHGPAEGIDQSAKPEGWFWIRTLMAMLCSLVVDGCPSYISRSIDLSVGFQDSLNVDRFLLREAGERLK